MGAMNNRSHKNLFELEVENFGPIEEGKVQLRPLTVFVGPNNAGKSYLATLVYALHQFFDDYPPRGFPHPHHEIFRNFENTSFGDSIIKEFKKIFQSIENKETISEPITITLPNELSDLIVKEIAQSGGDLGSEFERYFGFDSGDALIRKFSGKKAQVFLRSPKLEVPNSVQHKLTISANSSRIETFLTENLQLPIDVNRIKEMAEFLIDSDLEFEEKDKGEKYHSLRCLAEILYLAVRQLAGQFYSPAFYLPANRTGLMHAHGVAVSSLIERAALGGLRSTESTPMLSGVMADFLEQLTCLDNQGTQQNDGVSNILSDGIENSILGGKVRIGKSSGVDYPRFAYKPNGWSDELSLMNASSTVSELAPIVLYLRNVVSSGCTLIIEEPESHLNPAMQVELTRQIAKIVDSGINVIITTHSEWVLEKLANIVRRSEIADNLRSNSDKEEIVLRQDQVGVWLFRPNETRNGSTITEIQIDESGLYPSGFDEVAIELHNDWATISSGMDNSARVN